MTVLTISSLSTCSTTTKIESTWTFLHFCCSLRCTIGGLVLSRPFPFPFPFPFPPLSPLACGLTLGSASTGAAASFFGGIGAAAFALGVGAP